MTSDKYKQSVENLCKAIDIAINVFQNSPPKEWDSKAITHVINTHLKWKNMIENPEPRFRNMSSLRHMSDDFFIFFQEDSDMSVNIFWNEIKKQQLPYKRENKMKKILKRKKINNDIEYDFVIDVLVPYMEENLITEEEEILLKKLIGEFERKGKK